MSLPECRLTDALRASYLLSSALPGGCPAEGRFFWRLPHIRPCDSALNGRGACWYGPPAGRIISCLMRL